MSPELVTNSDVFLWALYELGGGDEFIDVEDVFIKAFELAPLRLSWRTRSELPDLKKCSKALRDAEGREPHLLVKRAPRCVASPSRVRNGSRTTSIASPKLSVATAWSVRRVLASRHVS